MAYATYCVRDLYYIIKGLQENRYDCIFAISGGTGCLAGDTIIQGQTQTLKELYDEGVRHIKTNSKSLNSSHPRRSKSEIFYSGKKEVYEIELENGKKVIATKDHKFFKRKNNKLVEEIVDNLKVGDKMVCYPSDYVEERMGKWAKNRAMERKNNHCVKNLCKKCNMLFFKNFKEKRTCCLNCLKVKKYSSKRKRDDVWYEWENNLLRLYYYDKEFKFIKKLIPHRGRNAIIHQASRLGLKRKKELQYIQNQWTSKKNPMRNPISRKKARDSLRKLYREKPHLLLNYKLTRDRMTYPEIEMGLILDKLGIKYEWNKCVKTKTTWRFPDFKVGNKVIEVDGVYWHKGNELKDMKRQKELEDIGLEVFRFTDEEIKNNTQGVENEIKNIFQN